MNQCEFRAAVARAGITNRDMATHLGMSEQALYNKANGKSEFKGSEIVKVAKLLNLNIDDVNLIFFDAGVNKIHTASQRRN